MGRGVCARTGAQTYPERLQRQATRRQRLHGSRFRGISAQSSRARASYRIAEYKVAPSQPSEVVVHALKRVTTSSPSSGKVNLHCADRGERERVSTPQMELSWSLVLPNQWYGCAGRNQGMFNRNQLIVGILIDDVEIFVSIVYHHVHRNSFPFHPYPTSLACNMHPNFVVEGSNIPCVIPSVAPADVHLRPGFHRDILQTLQIVGHQLAIRNRHCHALPDQDILRREIVVRKHDLPVWESVFEREKQHIDPRILPPPYRIPERFLVFTRPIDMRFFAMAEEWIRTACPISIPSKASRYGACRYSPSAA